MSRDQLALLSLRGPGVGVSVGSGSERFEGSGWRRAQKGLGPLNLSTVSLCIRDEEAQRRWRNLTSSRLTVSLHLPPRDPGGD